VSSLVTWQEVPPTSSLQTAFKIYLHCLLVTGVSAELYGSPLQHSDKEAALT